MTTPQENPDGQGWNTPHPGQDGRDRQDPYGPLSGYAYPGQGAGLAPETKGPAPQEVERAYHLILAAGVVYLLSSVLSSMVTEVPDIAGASLGVGIGILVAVVFAAVYVVLAVFIRRGHNWARITATVLAALNVLSVLATVLLLPLATRAAEAAGQTIPATPAFSIALSVIVTVLGVAGVAMTYLRPARPYFAARQPGY